MREFKDSAESHERGWFKKVTVNITDSFVKVSLEDSIFRDHEFCFGEYALTRIINLFKRCLAREKGKTSVFSESYYMTINNVELVEVVLETMLIDEEERIIFTRYFINANGDKVPQMASHCCEDDLKVILDALETAKAEAIEGGTKFLEALKSEGGN